MSPKATPRKWRHGSTAVLAAIAVIGLLALPALKGSIWQYLPNAAVEVSATVDGETAMAAEQTTVTAVLEPGARMGRAVISPGEQTAITVVQQSDGSLRLTPPGDICINGGTVTYEGQQFAFVVPPDRRYCGRQARITVLDPQGGKPLSVRDGPLTVTVAIGQ